MSRVKDLIGMRFGKLTALSYQPGSRAKKAKWLCLCDCGNKVSVDTYKLLSGHTKSCGCFKNESIGKATRKHGLKNTKLYGTWCNIKHRCYNPNNDDYNSYGGRGITVCEEWKNDFKAFYDWAITNGYRDGLTIDRKNVNGDYSPDNCRWVDYKAQARNKRNTVYVSLYGETKPLIEWCEIYNRNYQKAYDELIRYNRTTPEDFFPRGGRASA